MSPLGLTSFSRKVRPYQPNANANPPLSLFSKGGISSVPFKPLVGKARPEPGRRKGRFFPTVATNGVIVTAAAILLSVALTASCDRLPGKPDEAARWKRPTEVMVFNQLYAENCSGCHGADGRLGAARPLNDPLYLALVNNESLRQVIAEG